MRYVDTNIAIVEFAPVTTTPWPRWCSRRQIADANATLHRPAILDSEAELITAINAHAAAKINAVLAALETAGVHCLRLSAGRILGGGLSPCLNNLVFSTAGYARGILPGPGSQSGRACGLTQISFPVPTAGRKRSITAGWAMTPMMREWVGGRHPEGLRPEAYYPRQLKSSRPPWTSKEDDLQPGPGSADPDPHRRDGRRGPMIIRSSWPRGPSTWATRPSVMTASPSSATAHPGTDKVAAQKNLLTASEVTRLERRHRGAADPGRVRPGRPGGHRLYVRPQG